MNCFRIKFFLIWGMPLCALILGSILSSKGSKHQTRPRAHLSDEIFQPGNILTFYIELSDPEWTSLYNKPRSYVRANVSEGTQIYRDVALRIKGGTKSFQTIADKPSLTLNFDRYRGGQRLYGLDKIHLNNSVQDPSYLREWVSSKLFMKAGIPATRTAHAMVYINGKLKGLYVLKESYEKTFLKRHFSSSKGNFYKGEDNTDIDQELEKESGKGLEDQIDLKQLSRAAKEHSIAKRYDKLRGLLEIEPFIRYLALEQAIGHVNGYSMSLNNYRLYHNPQSGKFVMLPSGMETAFPRSNRAVETPPRGLLAKAVLEIPELSKRLDQHRSSLGELFKQDDVILVETKTVQSKIREKLALANPSILPRYEGESKHVVDAFNRLMMVFSSSEN